MDNLKKYIISMFDNYTKGASMRKVLAFVTGVVFAGLLHFKYVDKTNAFKFLMADLGCALLCLGIITMEQIIKFKQSNAIDVASGTMVQSPDQAQN